MLASPKVTIVWLNLMKIQGYLINPDLTIDVDGDVDISNKRLAEIPVQFGEVKGSFICHGNNLVSLKGSPRKVGKNFDCFGNKLVSLRYCPIEVGGSFFCNENRLSSLDFAPKKVGEDFHCEYNAIKEIYNFKTEFNGLFMHTALFDAEFIKGFEQFYCLSDIRLRYSSGNTFYKLLKIDQRVIRNIQQHKELIETFSNIVDKPITKVKV